MLYRRRGDEDFAAVYEAQKGAGGVVAFGPASVAALCLGSMLLGALLAKRR